MNNKLALSVFIIMALSFLSCEKKAKPVVNTSEITDISTTSAVSGGNISDDRGSEVTAFGICWNTSENPTVDNNTISGNSENASFTSHLTGLSPKSTYFVRAFAINAEGTGYGETRSFTTLGDTPETSPVNASDITINSATLNGIANPHSLSTTAVFEWGITTSYGNTASIVENPVTGSEARNISASITNLSPGTTYLFRIRAENTLGNTYSSDRTFRTLGETPEIMLTDASEITINTAKLTGSVNPNSLPTSVSFEWGTTITYGNTIILQSTVNGVNTVNLSTSISGLMPQTKYHYRIVATNELGTKKTEDMSFSTYATSDIENNYYHSVTIGTQTWLVENLKSTRFNDGTLIPNVTDQNEWNYTHQPAYCFYNNNSVNGELYGALYNYWTVDWSSNGHKKICPTGWHIPAKAEWTALFTFLTDNGFGNGGAGNDIAKSLAAKTGWNTDFTTGSVGNNPGANNSTGFTAFPGGIRTDGTSGFIQMGVRGSWWGTPDDYSVGYSYWCNDIFNFEAIVHQANNSSNTGQSIRCIKD